MTREEYLDHLQRTVEILMEVRAINDLDWLNRNRLANGGSPSKINREVADLIERAAFHVESIRASESITGMGVKR